MQNPFTLVFGKSPLESISRLAQTNEFNPYRDTLKKRGIINCEEHGYVHFALPEFGEYVLIHV